jgi:hypothetical protein
MPEKSEVRIYYSKIDNPFEYPQCPVCGGPLEKESHDMTVFEGSLAIVCEVIKE